MGRNVGEDGGIRGRQSQPMQSLVVESLNLDGSNNGHGNGDGDSFTHARTPLARAVYKGGSRLSTARARGAATPGGDLLEAPCDAMGPCTASCRGARGAAVIGRRAQGCSSAALIRHSAGAAAARQKRLRACADAQKKGPHGPASVRHSATFFFAKNARLSPTEGNLLWRRVVCLWADRGAKRASTARTGRTGPARWQERPAARVSVSGSPARVAAHRERVSRAEKGRGRRPLARPAGCRALRQARQALFLSNRDARLSNARPAPAHSALHRARSRPPQHHHHRPRNTPQSPSAPVCLRRARAVPVPVPQHRARHPPPC